MESNEPHTKVEEMEIDVGPHRARIVPPDIARVWWNGMSRQSDLDALFEFSTRWFGDQIYFVIADFTNLTGIDPAARRYATLSPRLKQIRGLALIGTSFHLRVMMTMLQTAAKIMGSAPDSFVRVCDNEQDAFAWIESERKRMQP